MIYTWNLFETLPTLDALDITQGITVDFYIRAPEVFTFGSFSDLT